ncbi:Tetratricopeptide-like helical [Penicillium vulpinum]|uniref:Protein kinase domain-containing protein n=1 Tax=Penicillium vulpinum TaxID=29845 RepID=A0A1V6RHH8_9EURO|nr:Tetratricopeptide-like helical [Penicillium vulpinum]KAJ5958090.1 Tetratricopeptide-like helical [Penicillium vulpinum]OQE01277.1 hypothetical protein PENVUL_c043G08944 [Penicillium vulpinum]
MANTPDLVLDSKLETYYLPDCTVETVHAYHEPNPNSRRRLVTRTEHWRREKKIGSGAYGSVWLEKCTQGARSDREIRAVKQIEISGRFGAIDYNRELEAIAKFSHSRYERCFVKSLGWYDSPEYLLIAMEYLEIGDLSAYLNENPPLPEGQAQELAYQILDGLNMMHDNNFAHRDLKPNNILIQSHPPDEWWIKISDFGISKRIEEAPGASTTLRGTSSYIAPELYGLINRGTPFASDIWALGQIVFQLLTKEMVFEHLGSLASYVMQANKFPTGRLAKSSALSVGFINSLMCPIPNDRMTAAMAISHTWIQSKPSPSNLETMISLNTQESSPINSVPATTAISHTWVEPNLSLSGSENITPPYTQDLSTISSMTETSISWNTNPSYPAPEMVDDVLNSKVDPHHIDIQLWRKFDVGNLYSSVDNKVTFSPNGEWLVIPAGRQTRLYNTLDGTSVSTLIEEDDCIHIAAFSPNGEYLATHGRWLIIWGVAPGLRFLHTIFGVWYSVQCIAFSQDKKLVACSSASRVEVWDVESSEKLFMFEHPKSNGVPLTFSPDGLRLLRYVSVDNRVWIQDLDTGDFFVSSKSTTFRSTGPTFSPGGRYLAYSYGAVIYVLDLTKETSKVDPPKVGTKSYRRITGSWVVECPDHWVKVQLDDHIVGPLAFSPNGNFLAACIEHNGKELSDNWIWTIVLWSVVQSGNGTFKLEELHRSRDFDQGYKIGSHPHLAFSLDGTLFVSSNFGKDSIGVWRADTRGYLLND